jgi:hypothetical protein
MVRKKQSRISEDTIANARARARTNKQTNSAREDSGPVKKIGRDDGEPLDLKIGR